MSRWLSNDAATANASRATPASNAARFREAGAAEAPGVAPIGS